MAKKFKDHYNTGCARLIATKVQEVDKKFDAHSFVSRVKTQIRGKGFLERQDVFSQALNDHLGPSYEKNLKIFGKILGPPLKQDTGMFTYGYWLWPIGRYIEHYGPKNLDELDKSLSFIYELTRRFTGEFAIRPLLSEKPNQVLPIIKRWSQDKDVHVRRLASEALRVRLPWAPKMEVFHSHFNDCFDILDALKTAPEKFVQKSVGNNINDLYKDRPDLAECIVERWKKTYPLPSQTAWILKHGQRRLTQQ